MSPDRVDLPHPQLQVYKDSTPVTISITYEVTGSGRGDGGTISCRILADGVEVVKNTASGPYSIVTCQDRN
ncbi:hypothetical protein [Cryptosporangium phraense]|uniref:Uncharacterized protein n=1 Tax=Cryptosporangium phraense TaxID=2593070 RepID=A0A545AKM4_9ACTN|nr:hypothetical protein [Cryptosporangium phraense]TQS41877.1 hypothetical protein FL583_26695 [Cryptosporangium phraense]